MKKLKKIIATAAVLAALFVQPARSQEKDSNLYLNGSYQDTKYELNLGTQLKLDDFSPYIDLKFDNNSQDYGLGLKLKGIGEAVGGLSNSSSQKSTINSSIYDKTFIITDGTSRDYGTISETENLEEKILGYRGGAEFKFGDKTFGINLQYLNFSQTTTSKTNISNLTKDNYLENTHEVQGSTIIDIETKVATDVTANTEVNRETKAIQNSARVQLSIADIIFPFWTYNLSSVNNNLNITTKVDSITTGYTKITINNGIPSTTPISSTSSTNSTNSQVINQEIKSNLFGLRANIKTESFNPSGGINYDDTSKKIDSSITSITKFLCGEKISVLSQNGKQIYGFEITDGKDIYANLANLEKQCINVNDMMIYDDSKKQQLLETAENNSLANRNWRLKLAYTNSISAEAGINTDIGFVNLKYDDENQNLTGKLITKDFSGNISYSNKEKKTSLGVEIPIK